MPVQIASPRRQAIIFKIFPAILCFALEATIVHSSRVLVVNAMRTPCADSKLLAWLEDQPSSLARDQEDCVRAATARARGARDAATGADDAAWHAILFRLSRKRAAASAVERLGVGEVLYSG